MSRWLVAWAALAASLLLAAAAGAAQKADSVSLMVSPLGNGQFSFQVQNTGDTVISSFVLVPGSGFTASAVTGSSAGACALSGTSISCTGLSLAPGCPCSPGQSVAVTVSGTGDPSGSNVFQIVGVQAPSNAAAGATAPATASTSPTAAGTGAGSSTTRSPVVVTASKTISLAASPPMLTLRTKSTWTATLSVTLVDATGHTRAHWSQRVKAGSFVTKLPVPSSARKVGRYSLRIAGGGASSPRTLSVLLRA